MTEQPPQYPPPPPGGYGYPPPAPSPYGGYPQSTGTNGLAIASLVCSLFGWICGVGTILGLVLGLIALSQIKKTGQEGRGMALAGVIISSILLAGGVLWFIFLILLGFLGDHDTTAMLMTVDPQLFSRAALV